MKIELSNNKIFFENNGSKKEIHPFWLRERVNGEDFVDKGTQQRLFDPTELKKDIEIKRLNLSDKFLEVSFNDGVETKFKIPKSIILSIWAVESDFGNAELPFSSLKAIVFHIYKKKEKNTSWMNSKAFFL